jgi:hypothetical protein
MINILKGLCPYTHVQTGILVCTGLHLTNELKLLPMAGQGSMKKHVMKIFCIKVNFKPILIFVLFLVERNSKKYFFHTTVNI